jgi:hypothetical protein
MIEAAGKLSVAFIATDGLCSFVETLCEYGDGSIDRGRDGADGLRCADGVQPSNERSRDGDGGDEHPAIQITTGV